MRTKSLERSEFEPRFPASRSDTYFMYVSDEQRIRLVQIRPPVQETPKWPISKFLLLNVLKAHSRRRHFELVSFGSFSS